MCELGKCRVSEAEKNFDHANLIIESQQRIERAEKRGEVIELSNKFLAGKPVKLEVHGRPYTLSLAANEVAEHELFDGALFAAYQDHPQPMKELLLMVVRHRACEFLYFNESDYLGFEI